MVYSYEEERVGLEAAKLGLALIEDLLPEDLCPEPRFKDAEFDFQTIWRNSLAWLNVGNSGFDGVPVQAAEERDIPWIA